MKASLNILGVISLVGAVVTFLFTPETKGRSLEENERESSVNGNNSEGTELVTPHTHTQPTAHALEP